MTQASEASEICTLAGLTPSDGRSGAHMVPGPDRAPDVFLHPSLLDRLRSGARVTVIRLRSLGDCVLTTPAIALLKTFRPDLRIHVVVEDRFAGVFEGSANEISPDVSEISERVQPSQVLSTGALSPLPSGPADLVINLHGGTRSMWMTSNSGAKLRVGFAHHRYSFLYSHKIPTAQEILAVDRPVHTAEHLASAMFWLGVPRTEIPRAKLSAARLSRQASYMVMHPFASAPEKAWPVERFVQVAEQQKKAGLDPVIVAGPQDDTSPFSKAGFEVLNNAPLDQVKTLMAWASLFIGNDSGPAHIAAAFGVPVVALFGPSNPATWRPWRTECQVLTSQDSIANITLESVLAAAETLKLKASQKVQA